jgi:hypothetical protein
MEGSLQLSKVVEFHEERKFNNFSTSPTEEAILRL